MYCPLDGGAGNTTMEQFAAFSVSLDPGARITVGQSVLLKSINTGK